MSSNVWIYGDSINTDLVIAGKYTKTLNFQDLADHCMEDLDPTFAKMVKEGDYIVAGDNFGCGSSREQAPLALKYSGIKAVLAKSFARIFYRNAINVGLPVIVCDTDEIKKSDSLEVDLDKGNIIVNGTREIYFKKLPPIMQTILAEGGLANFLKKRGEFKI